MSSDDICLEFCMIFNILMPLMGIHIKLIRKKIIIIVP